MAVEIHSKSNRKPRRKFTYYVEDACNVPLGPAFRGITDANKLCISIMTRNDAQFLRNS